MAEQSKARVCGRSLAEVPITFAGTAASLHYIVIIHFCHTLNTTKGRKRLSIRQLNEHLDYRNN